MLPHLKRLNVLLAELRRRHVFRAVAVYAVGAWAMVEVSSTILPVFPVPDPDAVIRILVVLVVLFLPLVLVLAWAFDLTVEGVQRTETEETAPQAVAQFLRSPSFQATLVLLVLLMTGGAGWLSWRLWLRPGVGGGSPQTSREASLDPSRLAVLYFDDFSEGGELGYLADGITEALIHELSQMEALQVISRNGVKPYRDLTIPLDSLARLLDVGSIVEGSVEGSGDRIRVTVQLIEGESEAHLMSERIQGRGEDALALRDSIVGIAVRSLGQTLGRELQRRRVLDSSTDAQAWALYQEAEHLREDADTLRWALGDTASARRTLRQADSLFARASELDPNWVEPLISRGWVARTLSGIFSSSATQRDSILLAMGIRQAEAALQRDSGNAEALELRGTLRADLFRSDHGRNRQELVDLAKADLRAALTADPSRAVAWVSLANLLRQQGEFEEASVAAQHALDADPFLINAEKEILFILSQVWLDMEDVERATRWYDEGRRRYPAEPSFAAAKLVILAGGAGGGAGLVDSAYALVGEVGRALGNPRWPLGLLQVAAVLAQQGMADSALAVVDGVGVEGRGSPGPWNRYFEANVRLRLGQEEEAMDLLASFLDELPQRKAYIARDWWWKPLRAHPRFQALVEE